MRELRPTPRKDALPDKNAALLETHSIPVGFIGASSLSPTRYLSELGSNLRSSSHPFICTPGIDLSAAHGQETSANNSYPQQSQTATGLGFTSGSLHQRPSLVRAIPSGVTGSGSKTARPIIPAAPCRHDRAPRLFARRPPSLDAFFSIVRGVNLSAHRALLFAQGFDMGMLRIMGVWKPADLSRTLNELLLDGGAAWTAVSPRDVRKTSAGVEVHLPYFGAWIPAGYRIQQYVFSESFLREEPLGEGGAKYESMEYIYAAGVSPGPSVGPIEILDSSESHPSFGTQLPHIRSSPAPSPWQRIPELWVLHRSSGTKPASNVIEFPVGSFLPAFNTPHKAIIIKAQTLLDFLALHSHHSFWEQPCVNQCHKFAAYQFGTPVQAQIYGFPIPSVWVKSDLTLGLVLPKRWRRGIWLGSAGQLEILRATLIVGVRSISVSALVCGRTGTLHTRQVWLPESLPRLDKDGRRYEHREDCEVGQRMRGVIGPRTVHTACHGADAKGDRLRSELSAEEGCPVENRLATGSGEVLTHTLYINDLGDFKVRRGKSHTRRQVRACTGRRGPQAAFRRDTARGRAISGGKVTQRSKGEPQTAEMRRSAEKAAV
ncbi:hypothetical protein DFH09DRAFT_1095357 [Mycena vulgaris]|nr:hypothetical protein DFH09DRAFT_1095357 [Mycena vulgaris]